MIDNVEMMIGQLYFWEVNGGYIDTYSIWKNKLSFPIFKIECSSHYVGHEFTWVPMQDIFHGGISVESYTKGGYIWGMKFNWL